MIHSHPMRLRGCLAAIITPRMGAPNATMPLPWLPNQPRLERSGANNNIAIEVMRMTIAKDATPQAMRRSQMSLMKAAP